MLFSKHLLTVCLDLYILHYTVLGPLNLVSRLCFVNEAPPPHSLTNERSPFQLVVNQQSYKYLLPGGFTE